jgi:hypothetical protein
LKKNISEQNKTLLQISELLHIAFAAETLAEGFTLKESPNFPKLS